MSQGGCQDEGEGEGKGTNLFNNDGSFMEQFMKMQQEQSGPQSKATEGDAPTTSKPVSMKLAPIKKKPAPTSLIQKRIQSRAARKAFVECTDSDGEGENASTEPSATPSATVADVKSSSASPSTPAVASTTTKVGGRKRKSKWDMGAPEGSNSRAIHEAIGSFMVHPATSSHSSTTSGQQLTSAQLEQIKEQITMQKMVAEIKTATQQNVGSKRNRYEYDSDEDTEEGTWEHKARTKEMKNTEENAKDLTEMGKGKHHIGDFLPPEELEKFIETVKATKEDRPPDFSDYKEHKLTEDNIGFKLLQKSGWDEGTGLGAQQQGITAPVNKGKQSFDQSGVGAVKPAEVKKTDDEFDLYRKRMMLAYRFRPNPLNNPRRPYY